MRHCSPEPEPGRDPATVTFRVLAAENDAPLAGALVGMGLARDTTERGTLQVATTGADGVVCLPADAQANIASLFVCAPGRRSVLEGARSAAGLPATVALEAGLTFAGVLRDARGEPVASATIGLVAEGVNWSSDGPGANFGHHRWPPCTSDAGGRFAWSWFDAAWFDRDDARCFLVIEHDRYVPTRLLLAGDLTVPGVRDLHAVLDEGRTLRARLNDPRGVHVASGRLEVSSVTRQGPMSSYYRKTAVLGADGWFVVHGLRPELHVVEASAPGCAPVHARVDLAKSENLVLKAKPGSSLEGVALDANGAPRADHSVALRSPWYSRRGVYRAVVADAEGKFRFDGLPARGTFRLTVGMDCVATVRMPSPPVELRPQLVRREFQIVDAGSGAPLAGAALSYGGAAGSSGRLADSEGRVAIEVPPGWYMLCAVAPDHAGKARFVRIRARAQAQPCVLRLSRGRTLLGQVRDEHGAPIPHCRITARHVIRQDPRETRADADGRFELAHLRGSYWLGVHAPGFESQQLRLRVRIWLPFAARVRVRLARSPADTQP